MTKHSVRAVITDCQRGGSRKVVEFELPLRGSKIYYLATDYKLQRKAVFADQFHKNNFRLELKILG